MSENEVKSFKKHPVRGMGIIPIENEVKENCKFCENLSQYSRNACENKLRGFKCQFVGTKTYWINRAGLAEKQKRQLKEEKAIALDALERIERYKNNCYMFKVENDTHYIDFKYVWEICNIAKQAIEKIGGKSD